MSNWLQHFERCFQLSLPDSYMVFDLETTGFRVSEDLPIDIGWCIVRDRKPKQSGNLVLDWTRCPEYVEPRWLSSRMDYIREQMAARGSQWIYDLDYFSRHGKHPIKVLRFFLRLLRRNRKEGAPFVGHNAWSFDCPLLQSALYEYFPDDEESFCFLPNEVYDTGGIEKAMQAGMMPEPQDKSLKDYFLRVCRARRAGIRWNLQHCLEKYALHSRTDVDKDKLHEARTDAYVTHLLFEELRKCQR